MDIGGWIHVKKKHPRFEYGKPFLKYIDIANERNDTSLCFD